ncbi:MAG: hypothetical protein EBR60_07090 [Burkholderiaceae bacterium]|jgi:hypothetical protein|nr:hypothetical protein [Burkholderiaceae bacterium]
MLKKIKAFEDKGITFGVSHLIEIFPSPLPDSSDNGEISSEGELFRTSNSFGFDELYLNDTDTIEGESNGKKLKFSLKDFVQWQLERMQPITLLHLINKTCASVDSILDFDTEYEKDEDYYPEGWLNVYESQEMREKGLAYIERLRKEVPKELYEILVDAILDKEYGLLNTDWYESELDDNLDEIRRAYSHWDVPLMVVSKGKFLPYIEVGYTHNLMMDDYNLKRMYIRNYDEGDRA